MVSEQVVKLTSWVAMAPKKNRKQPQDSMLEEPVDDQVAPPESIGEEEPMPREDPCPGRNPCPRRTKMSPKVKRNTGARSYSPKSNWKYSSRWVGPTLVSWWRPSKQEPPRVKGFNRPSPGTLMALSRVMKL